MLSKILFSIILQNQANEWANFVGHFHPVLVHLPIGILVIGIVLEFVNRKSNSNSLARAINIVFFWGAISAIISCIAGYFLQQSGDYDLDTLNWHQNLGISVAVISSIIYLFKKLGTLSWLRFFDRLIMPLAAVLSILLIITGHLGGNMTHGSDYLTATIPQPFKGWLGIEAKSKTLEAHKISDPAKALAYSDIIEPLLATKCMQCHNADKQKGGLRMDSKTLLAKGGKNGVVFLANNAASSEMIKRALLPENEENHMPPKGKPQLTEAEIELLHWWIQSGASFDKKVNDLPQNDKVKPVLTSLLAGATLAGLGAKSVPESPVYAMKVPAASIADLEKLRALNLLVLPLSKSDNLLEVNCINARNFNDEEAKLLNNVSGQIVSFKLTNTKITDASLSIVGKMPNLVKLFLNNTSITDKGINELSGLKYLEYLNLYNTQITDASLPKLAQIKSLKKLFLWQTKVTKPAVEAFKKANPNIMVDTGYEGQNLVTDTTVMKNFALKNVK
jgi:uncharacterized membrane protein/mono/diheme cytochrome c family protein